MPIQHAWRPVSQYEGSPYEERHCSRCDLTDTRNTSNPTFPEAEQWKVNTFCIVRVPGRISYRKLVSEIFLNVKNERDAQQLVHRVRCVGIPTNWQVGLYIVGTGVVYPHRDKPFRYLEEGFAELLRWLRARQFDPYKYSGLRDSESLTHDFCGCDDD